MSGSHVTYEGERKRGGKNVPSPIQRSVPLHENSPYIPCMDTHLRRLLAYPRIQLNYEIPKSVYPQYVA